MFRFFVILLFVCVLAGCTTSKRYNDVTTVNETIEWTHSWMVNTNDKQLPRVLIIGDSHVEGYFKFIDENLKSIANCCRFTTSKSLGDPILIDQLELFFKQYDFDIICFNNGLHGKTYSIEEYGKYIPIVYEHLKDHSKKAIIWVNTTATRKPGNLNELSECNDQVLERNKLVADFANTHGILQVDFYSLSINNLDYYVADGTRFNQNGQKAEASLICQQVSQILKIDLTK
jgi:hypothetical protein